MPVVVLPRSCATCSTTTSIYSGSTSRPRWLTRGSAYFETLGRDPNRIWLGSVLEPEAFRGPPEASVS